MRLENLKGKVAVGRLILVVLATATKTMTTSRDLNSTAFAEVTIVSDPAEARPVQDQLEDQLRTNLFTDNEIFGIKLALEEALVNAIKHAEASRIDVTLTYQPTRVILTVADDGHGFDPSSAAASAGHFGLVVGVDRAGQADALYAQGADVVVKDLADLLAK